MKALREHSKVRSSAKIAKYMKGGNVTDCRADGGTVKAKRPTQSVPITVDGKAARPRLDRPMRKRADGGSTLSRDSEREITRLRNSATNSRLEAPMEVFRQLPGMAAGQALNLLSKGRAGKLIGHGITGAAGVSGVVDGNKHLKDATAASDEADRIERARPESGKEDRKHGGRVKR